MNGDRLDRGALLRWTVVLLLGSVVVQLFVLQIVRHDAYRRQAKQNREVERRVPAPRGRILDREGNVLADNVFGAAITVSRRALTPAGPDSTLSRLLTWFALPEAETLERLLRQQREGRSRLVLVSDATMPQIALVREMADMLPGVAVETRRRRRYHRGPLFAHLLGYVGEVSADDMRRHPDREYRPGDMVGRTGLEATREAWLRGRDGRALEEIDARGRVVSRRRQLLRPVQPGRDLRLTLSAALQESLAAAMAGRRGCGVAMALPTGEILAAVSLPTFDPNRLAGGISSDRWRSLTRDPEHPLLNRLVQAIYPPGSPYKIVTSLTAFRTGAAGPHTRYLPCTGSYRFGNRIFRCWKATGHGDVDHTAALVHSCDVFYYQLVQHLDLASLAATARLLGLGRRTGVPLPGELAGNIPTREWYDRRFGRGRWSRGVLLNDAIGQGEVLVTPLQMVVMTGRVATGLADLSPRLVLPDSGAVAPAATPLALPAPALDWLQRTMRQVVDIGTGMRARLASMHVAGKTGTAQNPHGEDHAWFVCYAPAEAPRVAVAVILENAGHGGAVAAPVAARWLRAYAEWSGEGSGRGD